MQTDDLIRALAAGITPTPRGSARRCLLLALLTSLPLAVALMVALLGPQPLGRVAALPMFWVKLGLPLAVVVVATLLVTRLARPGARLEAAPVLLALPFAAVWGLALVVWLRAPAALRPTLVFGDTWRWCPWLIAGLALPSFIAVLWALKGLAPTRLRLAGAAAGLLAGAVGAMVYAFHCPELAAPFIGLWYVLGMSLPAAAGALLGPWLLRWA